MSFPGQMMRKRRLIEKHKWDSKTEQQAAITQQGWNQYAQLEPPAHERGVGREAKKMEDPYKDFMHIAEKTMNDFKDAILHLNDRVSVLEKGGSKSPLLTDNPLFINSSTFGSND